ncbi:MAG: glycosyltransferase [Actinomycetota bacterium]
MTAGDPIELPTPRPLVTVTMSRFPKLTETFVLNELVALPEHGVDVEIFPLLRERAPVVNPVAERLAERAHFYPFVSTSIVASNVRCALRHPRAYFGSLLTLVRQTWRSANFLVGGLGIFPKVVAMAERMKGLGVDHVHCHFATHPAVAGWLIHRLVGIPYSFTAHGSDLHVDRTMLPMKAREAAFVVTISEDNKDLMLRECGASIEDSRVHVVRCGVDGTLFTPRPFRQPANELDVVCVGTLHEVKGQRHLIEACAELRDSGALRSCTFVGDGPDRDSLARLADGLGLSGFIRFAGALPSAEVAEHIRAADVLVAPSVPTRRGKREGIPVVLMEAMASGVPVLASRLSGIPELVQHECSGLLAPPGDSSAIASALLRLRDEPDLARHIVDGALATVRGEFDLHHNAEKLAALIKHRVGAA